jgi:predicted ArsR family transcriptional regulator
LLTGAAAGATATAAAAQAGASAGAAASAPAAWAAAEAKAVQANHHGNIIAVLSRFGPQGVDGIAARCGLTGHQVGKRMIELERLGSVAQTGKTVQSTSGRSQREWRIA